MNMMNNTQLPKFPVGYYMLHPDISLNFQMNRWYNWVGDNHMLTEMQKVASRIRSYTDFKREFLALAEQARANQQDLKCAIYSRAAEFFMFPGDPAKQPTRAEFLRLIMQYYGFTANDRILIPYESGMLSAYRIIPKRLKGTIVLFGGFDSYIEEWFPAMYTLCDGGYEVVAFDGPGQGTALEEYHLPMTFAWERPVKAVLDYFQLDDVTLMGFSLGGGFAIRTAAYESRVRRVIAYDVLTDFLEVVLRQINWVARYAIKTLELAGAKHPVNALLYTAMNNNLAVQWGIQQGMHVTGSASPYDFFDTIAHYQTTSISRHVKQDVLLMGGAEDHYIPLHQFTDQIGTLTNARSVTARLFMEAEHAQNHCQIGNLGLALKVITAWIDGVML